MGLLSDNNEYFKVSAIDMLADGSMDVRVEVSSYKDENTRNNLGKFDKVKTNTEKLMISNELYQNIIGEMYSLLKKLPVYENLTDVIEE